MEYDPVPAGLLFMARLPEGNAPPDKAASSMPAFTQLDSSRRALIGFGRRDVSGVLPVSTFVPGEDMVGKPLVLATLMFFALGVAAAESLAHESGSKSPQPPVIVPAKPIVPRQVVKRDARSGKVLLSDGSALAGGLYLKGRQRLRVWDKQAKKYRNVQLGELSKIEVLAVRERVEKEWRFKEEGSDVKVFTGRTFPRIDFEMTLTFADNRKRKCRIARGTPLYLRTEGGKSRRFLIQPYLKGEVAGKMPATLLYVKRVVFDAQAGEPKASPASDEPKSETKATIEDR